MKLGIERIEAEAFGDVLQRSDGAVIVGAVISPEARDLGNTPSTLLRAGLVMARSNDGTWKEFGAKLAHKTKVDCTNVSGAVYKAPDAHIVPYSETLYERVGSTDTELPRTAYSIDYVSGTIVLNTTLSSGASLVASYIYIDPNTADGTEYPLGILLNPVSLLNEQGVPVATAGQILLAGFVREDKILVRHAATLQYAKQALARRFIFLGPVEDY